MNAPDQPGWESAKQRTRRIALDYYRSWTRLDWAKRGCSALFGLLTAVYVLWTIGGWLVGSEGASKQFSPGPVAGVHQAWNGKCSACHVQFAALRADAEGTRWMLGLFTPQIIAADGTLANPPPAEALGSNRQCLHCHMKNGADHHPLTGSAVELAPQEATCAGCHFDHQGIDADLNRVANEKCTNCHGKLKTYDSTQHNVSAFNVAGHPPFALPATDPGNIKFNHAQHLLPWQMKWEPRAGEPPPSLKMQLVCADCHQFDEAKMRSESGSEFGQVAAGAYSLPIRYEDHCASCHRGDLQVAGGQIPHGLKAAEVREFLAGVVGRESADTAKLSPNQPIPGKKPGDNLAQERDASVQRRLDAILPTLWSPDEEFAPKHEAHCAKCHRFDTPPAAGQMPAVLAANIRSFWFQHAKFDHATHRAVNCADCHPQAEAPPAAATGDIPLDDHLVMIPPLETCVKCHAPGKARDDCAECHRYHAGNWQPHGPGHARRAAGQQDFSDFMRGFPAAGVK
ncbi:MAG: cytochrome c3 family protein [Pirellulaceae bacterium]|nr:cytochrome c3 family protein [Pirellulaceae bacterium]